MRLEEAEFEKNQALDEKKLINVFFNDLKQLSDARLEQIHELKKQLSKEEEEHEADVR